MVQNADQFFERALVLEHRGRFDEARSELRQALAVSEGAHRVEAGLNLARMLVLGGARFAEEAEALLVDLVRQTEAEGDRLSLAKTMNLQALLEYRRGNLVRMQEVLDASPVVQDPIPDGPEAAQWFHKRGLLASEQGDLTGAQRDFFTAHGLYSDAACDAGLSEIFDSLAGVLQKTGKTKSALQFCAKSLELKRRLKDLFGEAITLGTMGRIYVLQARYPDAEGVFRVDLALARELNDIRGVGIMLNHLGEVALLQGEIEEALTSYHESLAANDNPFHLSHAYLGLARVHIEAEDLTAASEAADRLAALLESGTGDPILGPALEGIRGSLAWRTGDYAAGEEQLQRAIERLHEKGQRLDTIPWLYELRDLYGLQGDTGKAVAVMSRALDLLSECGADRGVDDVEQWLRTVDHPGLTRLALERHFPEHLVEEIISGNLSAPPPQRQPVAVLFSDVRGFTTLSENLSPEEVVELLNEWFTEAARAIRKHNGVIDKFIGDAVMALFGVPEGSEDAAANAVRAAVEMCDALESLNLRHKALHGQTIDIGIGIDYGEAVVGFIGSHLRQSFTAIGDTVNTASRLEGHTKQFETCRILISEPVEQLQRDKGVAQTLYRGLAELKGKEKKVPVYEVIERHSTD